MVEKDIPVVIINEGRFTVFDYVIFTVMLGISLAVGLYSSFKKKNSTSKDYFVGGGSMPVWAVALSVVGGTISAISILGNF